MKRFLFLLALTGLLYGMGQTIDYDIVPSQGAVTPNNGRYDFVCDSADTYQVDTFFSDTIEIGDFRYLKYILNLDGYTLADSANDSVNIVVTGWGTYNNKISTLMLTDTIPTTLGTLDSTATISGFVLIDSLLSLSNRMYFRTIVSDSFISGYDVGGFSDKDSTQLYLRYQVLQGVEFVK